MSNLVKQFSELIEKDGIPENLKEVINNLQTNNQSLPQKEEAQDVSSSINLNGIDPALLLKMTSMMNGMNSKSNPSSSLLSSLKPYLKDSRKSKIEQYIQFLNIAGMMGTFKNTGGEPKNDTR
ncbi:MAG: hypothetical protein FWF46_05210 [Oscillospiraceae bacterium]|nr:hypothetical protein [Oscillospiraceae bacterium]